MEMKLNKFDKGFLNDKKIQVIAGPCSAESPEQISLTSKQLFDIGIRIFRAGVWKPRTKPGGFEGCGYKAIEWMKSVKDEFDSQMSIAMEVATPSHIDEAIESDPDILWIGARTTANPFAMQEIADKLATLPNFVKEKLWIFVKNPIAPDLELWIGGIERIYKAGFSNIAAIHRGFTVQEKTIYRNEPMWNIPIQLKNRIPGISLFCDPSHISGKRELILSVSQQALDLGFDGLMIESHCSPESAITDSSQQLTPGALRVILNQLVVRDNHDSTENMRILRGKIDVIDDELLHLLSKRFRICREIGIAKKENNMPIIQSTRFQEICDKRANQARVLEIDSKFISNLFESMQNEAIRQQLLV